MMFKHNLQSEKKTLLTKSKKVHKTKEKRKKSIRSRLIILFSLLVIVPVVLSSFVLYADMRGAVEYRAKREQKEATTKIVDLLYDAGNEAETTLLSISETEEINNLDQSKAVEQLNQSFSLLKQSLKYVSDVFIYSPGTNNIGTMSEENLYLSANAWYEGANNSNEAFYLSDTYEDNETGNETMAVIMQVPGQDQVIGVTLNLEKISTYVSDKKIGQTGYPLVISETGFSQLSQEDTDLSEDTLFTNATENSGELLSNLNNKTYPIYYERVNNLKMIVYGVIGSDEMKTESSMFLQKLTIILISALIIAVGIGYLVSEYIVTIAKTIQEALFKLGNGDMTARIYSFKFYPFKNFNKKNKNKRENRSEKKPVLDSNGHELQQIAISFNQAARSFNQMIEIVINKADEVSTLSQDLQSIAGQTQSSTEEVSKTIVEIAEATSVQTKDTEETTVQMKELSKSVDMVSKHITIISEQSDATNNAIIRNDQSLDQVHSNWVSTLKTLEQLKNNISTVDQDIQNIETILEVILEIAEKTNLLSLNASIEAARAGEAGRGFAVVAAEIRKLADQSHTSSDTISSIIRSVQNKSTGMVNILEKVFKESDNQTNSMKDVTSTNQNISKHIKELVTSINKTIESTDIIEEKNDTVVSAISEIAETAEETSSSTEEVSANTEEILATMDEFLSTIHHLKNLSVDLKSSTSQFIIK